ncbi:ABC transporter ATP-binding protein [Spirulina sp. 06S082]|uniref:ABC transporter ATP-binding protein n=1 Tax=Spirulina sp. 06S082 TaxID=3110248 RepID=UPI002B1F8A22|nr:ABC transporter ATP-binding protein [Spirulina sp. 06S082]MEA5471189.1 ABC transporter ATP-binding protein [Spirulina sp. 06S082]
MFKKILNRIKESRQYFPEQIGSPAYQLVLAIANHNRKYLVLAFHGNLLASALEAGTFGVIYLALGVLVGDITLSRIDNPIIANPLIESVLGRLNSGQTFIFLVLLAMTVQILKSLLQYLSAIWANELTVNISEQVSDRLFDIILRLSFPCASRYKVGDLVAYLSGAEIVQDQIRLWQDFLINLLMFLAYIVVIIWISPALSLFAIILSAILLGLQRYLAPRFRQLSLEKTNIGVEVAQETTESIQGLRLIHTLGKQQSTIEKVRLLRKKIIPVHRKSNRLSAIGAPLGNTLIIIVVSGLLIGGFGILGQSTRILVPALLTFVTAFNRMANQTQRVIRTLNLLANSFGQMTRLNKILDTRDKEFSCFEGQEFLGLQKEIIFDRVSLQYQGGKDFALKDLSFRIDKGKIVALVGSSGAGKSSIADLLVGLYDVTAGAILVDGYNLREYSPSSWRSRLGVVSQDTFIFNTSIVENIAYGMQEILEERAIEAAKQAQAHEFISNLPLGYNTIVGERGYRLSGGQRQRIALARAILKQPEVLILDEATSALDSQSERLLQEALGKFKRDRTALIIAHRLSTIVNADEIIVLERGCIIERGNHRELLALDGLYARYWQLQSQGSELLA